MKSPVLNWPVNAPFMQLNSKVVLPSASFCALNVQLPMLLLEDDPSAEVPDALFQPALPRAMFPPETKLCSACVSALIGRFSKLHCG